MGSILSTLFSAILSGLLGLFRKSPEQALGEATVKNEVQDVTIHVLEVDKAASDRIDGMSYAERVRLANEINVANDSNLPP